MKNFSGVKKGVVAMGRRGYAALSQEEVDKMWKDINDHGNEFISYSQLTPERRSWLRRINSVSLSALLMTGISSVSIGPYLLSTWNPPPTTILSLGLLPTLIGPEMIRLIADRGLRYSVPILLSLPLIFYGVPCDYMYNQYHYEFLKGLFIAVCAFILNGYSVHNGRYFMYEAAKGYWGLTSP